MKEDQAHSILEPSLERIALAIVKSFETYRTRYPHRPIHRRTTSANVICDEIWSEIVNSFADESPRIRPVHQSHGLRFLGVEGRRGEIEILLWFKKVDGKFRPRSYPTKSASRRLAGENLEMFQKATILIVGYHLNQDETRIVSVSITPPSLNGPEWHIDLELPEESKVVQMPHGESSNASPKRRVIVHRTKQLRIVE